VSREKAAWLIAGTILVLAASALMLFGHGDNALIPIPTHQFVLLLAVSDGYVLFLPAAYGLSLYLLWDRRFFGRAVLGFGVAIALLSVAWFVESWADGISYPGAAFTRAVAAENAVGLATAIVLAQLGLMRGSRPQTASAHLAIFLVLAWCAFPLLGRIDL